MPSWKADLHIHSCLSPCGDLESSPKAIVREALGKGLDLIALTDHNTARNIPAFASACREAGISALYGIEVTTTEEAHALVLFPDPQAAYQAGEEIYRRYESAELDPLSFGDQVWVDEEERVSGSLEKLLIIGTTDFSIDELGPWARERGGVLIPAHINRRVFGILQQLGFLPDGPFEAVEVTVPLSRDTTDPWTVVCSSDAHRPRDIGRRYIRFSAPAPDWNGLIGALDSGEVECRFEIKY